jgi:hypothetical protein
LSETLPSLFAPVSYWESTPEQRKAVCNGCGVAGWKGKFVPDTVWGLSIRQQCDIHDWMYEYGETEDDRGEADRAFLNNLIRGVDARGGWFAGLRRRRALKYYEAVHRFGGPAFWNAKNAPGEMGPA